VTNLGGLMGWFNETDQLKRVPYAQRMPLRMYKKSSKKFAAFMIFI